VVEAASSNKGKEVTVRRDVVGDVTLMATSAFPASSAGRHARARTSPPGCDQLREREI
jgi:hypothetical protein